MGDAAAQGALGSSAGSAGGRGPGGRLLGRVVGREALGSLFRLRLDIPGWRTGTPGQFALLQPEPSRVFLPRAFSLHEQCGTEVAFLVAPIGPGTEELGETRPGDPVWVLGPLGRGFDPAALIPRDGGRSVIVGGGVGVAPLPLVVESLALPERWVGRPRRSGSASHPEVLVLLGFRDAAQACSLSSFDQAVATAKASGTAVRLEVITEDGCLGRNGLVTALLSEELREGDVVAACGAHAMCGAVWEICRDRGCAGWFSLEAGMACGVGSCQGCVITLADGSLTRVCREGPVFSGAAAFGDRAATCAPEQV